MTPMLAFIPCVQLCWKPKEGRVAVMVVAVGVHAGLLLPGLWNWAKLGGIQQLSEWPSIRHSWVQFSEASARAFCRFTSIAVKIRDRKKKKRRVNIINQDLQSALGFTMILPR